MSSSLTLGIHSNSRFPDGQLALEGSRGLLCQTEAELRQEGTLLGAELASNHSDKQVFWGQREGQYDWCRVGKWKGWGWGLKDGEEGKGDFKAESGKPEKGMNVERCV